MDTGLTENQDKRKSRFKKVREDKMAKAKKIIESFKTLTVRSNFICEKNDLFEIIARLNWQVTQLMLTEFFKNSSTDEKLQYIVLYELEQLAAISVYDDALAKDIKKKYPKALLPAIENYIDRAAFDSPIYKDHVRKRYRTLKEMHKAFEKSEALIQKELSRLNKKIVNLD